MRPLIPFTQCVCVRSLTADVSCRTGFQSFMFVAADVCKGKVQAFNWTPLAVDDLRCCVRETYEIFLSWSLRRCMLMRVFLALHVSRAHWDSQQ